MKSCIVTPLKRGDLERAVAQGADEREVLAVNSAFVSIRQDAEWDVRRRRLYKIHRLYKYRVRRTNISQIRNVFSPPVIDSSLKPQT
ncbi:hypothetical protein PsorP6_015889 [Peronosclerospora sorghi]|uniref:Uncharacterized protein n=1 Tax=Peronosclerospora sorghi TaxID=230839 RepID=A0ACC0WQ34_9STRA|nr:hypothetical protein PsorP6_015889 [Peronosclerospora sorghi]